ncbi:uncharacterized protein LOC106879582, partial [Argonauta hians]
MKRTCNRVKMTWTIKPWIARYGQLLIRNRMIWVAFVTILLLSVWIFSKPCYNTYLDPRYFYMKPCEDSSPTYLVKDVDPDKNPETVTLVTAYFQLETFRKGSSHINSSTYKNWSSVYSRILNPIVFFTDSPAILLNFKKMRSPNLVNLTKLVLVNRTDLWAFGLKPEIARIFSQNDYPKFYPNTVMPDYSCVMHAKYELLKQSIQQNYFHTDYFMWIDIGYFRYEVKKTEKFRLILPKGFDVRSVAFSLVCDFRNLSLKQIIWQNIVWVAGGANVGRSDVLLRFCDDYMASVKRVLSQNLMSTDQQIIYAMNIYKNWSSVRLQFCHAGWFCLGYLSKYTWEQHQQQKLQHQQQKLQHQQQPQHQQQLQQQQLQQQKLQHQQ